MRLYRKAIPKIAREIIRSSNAQEHIELEDNKMEEAELDLAAILVTYMNEEEKFGPRHARCHEPSRHVSRSLYSNEKEHG